MRQVQSLQSSEGAREETVTMFSPMFTTTNAGLSFAEVLVGFLAIHIAVKFIDLESSGEEVFVEIVFDADVIFFALRLLLTLSATIPACKSCEHSAKKEIISSSDAPKHPQTQY